MPAHMTTEMTISAFTGSRCVLTFGAGWEVSFFDAKDRNLREAWEKHVSGRVFSTEIDLIKELGNWFRHRNT